jgi:hypothetical protein
MANIIEYRHKLLGAAQGFYQELGLNGIEIEFFKKA